MARTRRSDLIAGLDIGTESVRAVIAELTDSGVDIVGVGKSRSNGLKKGVVVNIESTMGSIRAAIDEAELMAGREVHDVYCSISGSHLEGMNSPGMGVILFI